MAGRPRRPAVRRRPPPAGPGPASRPDGPALARAALGGPLARALAGLAAGPAGAADGRKIRLGVLELTSSAPVFLGVERGTFREFGPEPELVYFQAPQPEAVAIAAREVDVGATGLTAGPYKMLAGGEGPRTGTDAWTSATWPGSWPGIAGPGCSPRPSSRETSWTARSSRRR
jgi:hypothetical protein